MAQPTLIGSPHSFWLHHPSTGYDLTHPSRPFSSAVKPRLTFTTTTSPITISPAKSALLIIDMQNFFLSPSLGRPSSSAGLTASKNLIEKAIPAARKAGMLIVWVNWGLTEMEVAGMDAGTMRAFTRAPPGENKLERLYNGLGADIGDVNLLPDETNPSSPKKPQTIPAGKALMLDQWNAALYAPLEAARQEGLHSSQPDVLIHKNRMGGLCSQNSSSGSKATTELETFLKREGIRTLFFAGVNTDQCVAATLVDAFCMGWDCVLLRDACGSSSEEKEEGGKAAVRGIEWNCERTWGFLMDCGAFLEGVEAVDNH
ncbi:MAG: hypothetical protein M1834_004525 [Cirrosporium novae-zelandiae]|nr:MAG: hypothetical protein M1834_004525 [Cirrosporium novae-zelandiae]